MQLQPMPTETLKACPSCGATQADLVWQQPETFIAEGLNLYMCCTCAQIYLNPRLTLESTTLLENQSEVYAYSEAAEQQEIALKASILAHIEQHGKLQPGRVLDLGCNRGLLLVAAQHRGWQSVGIELSPVAADIACQRYGLTVYSDPSSLAQLEAFDLITCWHVLEHLHEPVAFVQELAAVLKPEGVLAIQVPAYQFRDQFIEQGQAGSLLSVVHTLYFTAPTLISLVTKAGLCVFYCDESPEYRMLTVYACHPQALMARLEPPAWLLYDLQQATMRNAELTTQLRETQAQIPPLTTTTIDLQQYVATLEATIASKNAHIAQLETQINTLESGRLLRLLKALRRSS
ncbi:methyltransferase domain-containing protein [Herpetosiphon llansteffanensis]